MHAKVLSVSPIACLRAGEGRSVAGGGARRTGEGKWPHARASAGGPSSSSSPPGLSAASSSALRWPAAVMRADAKDFSVDLAGTGWISEVAPPSLPPSSHASVYPTRSPPL